MALTIAQIQSNITNKHDVREILNQLADYVQANPSAPVSSYFSYVALLSQVDTDAPTALVLANTLGGTVVWSYVDVGIYRGTLSGAFTANKTFVIINNTTSGAFMSAFDVGNTNEIEINILNGDQVAANGMLSLTSIEIRVYP